MFVLSERRIIKTFVANATGIATYATWRRAARRAGQTKRTGGNGQAGVDVAVRRAGGERLAHRLCTSSSARACAAVLARSYRHSLHAQRATRSDGGGLSTKNTALRLCAKGELYGLHSHVKKERENSLPGRSGGHIEA